MESLPVFRGSPQDSRVPKGDLLPRERRIRRIHVALKHVIPSEQDPRLNAGAFYGMLILAEQLSMHVFKKAHEETVSSSFG